MHGAHNFKILRIKQFIYLTTKRTIILYLRPTYTHVDLNYFTNPRLHKSKGLLKHFAPEWITRKQTPTEFPRIMKKYYTIIKLRCRWSWRPYRCCRFPFNDV
jgi:hypothetical protein